jgi:hypothetical protein
LPGLSDFTALREGGDAVKRHSGRSILLDTFRIGMPGKPRSLPRRRANAGSEAWNSIRPRPSAARRMIRQPRRSRAVSPRRPRRRWTRPWPRLLSAIPGPDAQHRASPEGERICRASRCSCGWPAAAS